MNKIKMIIQYRSLMKLVRNVTEIEDIYRVSQHEGVDNVEVNYNPLNEYEGEEIVTIRYEYKNILVYVNIEGGKTIINPYIVVYDNEGMEESEVNINEIIGGIL